MKKILSLILLISILFGIAPIVNANASSNVTLTSDNSTVYIGDTVTVTFKIAQTIQATDFNIYYPNDILEFVSTSVYEEHYNAIETGTIKVSTYETEGFDTFTFTFLTKAEGTATISTDIEALYIDHTDYNTLAFENKSANITVIADDTYYIKNENLNLIQGNEVTMISGINDKTTISELLSTNNFTSDYTIKAYKNDSLVTTGNAATGTVIKIFNGEEEVKEFTVVIYGDTTGDGKIESVDALAIIKNNLNKVNFSNEAYLEAGRVMKNKRGTDAIPNAVDALACIKYKLGNGIISQL